MTPDPEDVRRAKGTWGDKWLFMVEPSIYHVEMARDHAESNAKWEDPLDISLLSLLKRLSGIIGSGFINIDDRYTQEGKTYEQLDVHVYGRMATPLGGAALHIRTTFSTKGRKVWNFKFYPKGRPKSQQLDKVTTARMIEQGYNQGQIRGVQALIIALNALWQHRIDNGDDEAELRAAVQQADVTDLEWTVRVRVPRALRHRRRAAEDSDEEDEEEEEEGGEDEISENGSGTSDEEDEESDDDEEEEEEEEEEGEESGESGESGKSESEDSFIEEDGGDVDSEEEYQPSSDDEMEV